MSSLRAVLLVGMCICLEACGYDAPGTLVLVNDIEDTRPEEPVVITRADLESRLGAFKSGLVPVASYDSGTAIPGQVDDLDGNGIWDDWALLVSFGPRESVRIHITMLEPTELPVFKPRTNVRVENASSASKAVVWENDVIGFRMPLDRPAGTQVLGKITTEMVFDSVRTAGIQDEMALWGMDILNVTTTMGAGGLAAWTEGKLVVKPSNGHFKLLAEGPARSVFEVEYPDWAIGDDRCDVTERVTVWAGRPGFERTVSINGPETDFTPGIAGSRSDSMHQYNWGMPHRALAAHGLFTASDDAVGLAVLYAAEQASGVGADSASKSYFVRLHVRSGAPSTHYLYAVWEQQNYRWADLSNFEDMLEAEARRLASPIRLR